jgi:DNA repair exonuclease SbcCD ATPase subunit
MPIMFAEWLSKFTDIVNLGKLVVDGGPGALLTIALVSMLSHWTGVPVLPLGEKFDERLSQSAIDLRAKRDEVAEAENVLQQISVDQAELSQRLATVRTEREAVRAERSSLEIRGVETSTVRYQRLQDYERELTARIDGKEATADSPAVSGLAEQIAEVEGDKALQTERLATLRAELVPLSERYERLRVLRIESGTHIVNLVLDHLIGIVIVGYLLGTMLSPLYRALFVNAIDHAILRVPTLASFAGGAEKPPQGEELARIRQTLSRIERRLAALTRNP